MAVPTRVGHRPQLEDCADESGLAYERDASMSAMPKQDDRYFMVPVKFIDLYWVEKNAQLAEGDEPSQTEFMGDLFFNDAVYERVCEGCGEDMRSGYEDESGVSYCFKCLGEMVQTGKARIEKVGA